MRRRARPELTVEERVARRRVLVNEIHLAATQRGYIVTIESVAKNYATWKLWFDGKLSPGHLVNALSVRYTGQYPRARWPK